MNINEKDNSGLAWAEAVRPEPLDEPAGFRLLSPKGKSLKGMTPGRR